MTERGVVRLLTMSGHLKRRLQSSCLTKPYDRNHYLNLSWLAASMGITAGALGSNFDGDQAVREATYSRREHQ
ncbi:hypothetical protein IWX75_000702 [Arthrobacter sp. CAN_A6]